MNLLYMLTAGNKKVYIASLLPPVGVSNADLMGGQMPPFVLEAVSQVKSIILHFPSLPTSLLNSPFPIYSSTYSPNKAPPQTDRLHPPPRLLRREQHLPRAPSRRGESTRIRHAVPFQTLLLRETHLSRLSPLPSDVPPAVAGLTIPVAAQEMMIEMARKQGARIAVETCESGHTPIFSVPERVAQVILGAVASINRCDEKE